MKYLKTFESFNSSYFVKLLTDYMALMDKDNLPSMDVILDDIIGAAKKNLDSNPSDAKIEQWKSELIPLIDAFIKKGHFKSDSEEEMEKEETIRKQNLNILSASKEARKELMEIPKYYVDEVGIDVILDFLKAEDGMNFILSHSPNAPNFSKEDEPQGDHEDIVKYIQRRTKNKYSWEQIQVRLIQYFLRRLAANVSREKVFVDETEAVHFLKVYIQKFLYGYLIPMAKR